MSENIQRSAGRPANYKFDRGGNPTEMGPYIGIVVNNVDDTRSGRLQVCIKEFGAIDAQGNPILDNTSLWRKVSYISPFYGSTQPAGANSGAGSYTTNSQSYGMWFTVPDLGTQVICFFVNGDPDSGYYIGCVPVPGANHMIPAIGASSNYVVDNANQSTYFNSSAFMPVTEINTNNKKLDENPQFFNQPKPVHAVQAGVLFQQGLNQDPDRGPINSSSMRESPSSAFGISTPGRPVYQGGMDPATITQQLERNEISPQDAKIIGRLGGHTLVMDDGDLQGNTSLLRLRTSKGHQITMSDSGNFFYITHANGQTWLEFGAEGTVDVFSTNSINLRSQGDINFHADRDINMFAGNGVNIKSNAASKIEAAGSLSLASVGVMSIGSETKIGIITGGSLALKGKTGYFGTGGTLSFIGSKINLNSGGGIGVDPPTPIKKTVLAGTEFNTSRGWIVKQNGVESICTRVPTHEPWPYHNLGVDVKISLETGQPATPPAAQPVPSGWNITVK